MPHDAKGFAEEQVDKERRLCQSKRFEKACELMRINAEKFLKDDFHSESSSSEDEIDNVAIVEKTLFQYSDTETESLRKTRDFLRDILTSGFVVCLVCIESIKRNDKIWSCKFCYCMLHLGCIQKWAKDSLFHKSADDELNRDRNALKWCCPKCRWEYAPSDQPEKYLCFCGKVENPPFDVWNVPHSCGKSCEKKFTPDCGHTCSLLCHPGPCPPCPQTVLISCCCFKSECVVRRCSKKEWCCSKTCKKLLSCKLHYCDKVCHEGPCPPCKEKREEKCFCGSKSEFRPCDNPKWQCEKVCGRLLKCENHFCSITCHEEPCPECPDSGPRPCPCKKNIISLPCTEKIMPCGDTCNKLLECELHRCTQRCHFGPCGTCLQMRVMKCRCGQREKSVPCCKEFICDIKCKKRRDCGKHYCNKKCCARDCPPCEAPCGRTLNCGNHRCTSLCHPGPCYPCRETLNVSCNCGITKITVPCGRKKSAIPPRCSAHCRLPSDCHHKERQKHQCHFGSCPPCRLICGKILNCGHKCAARCHSAVLTKIQVKEEKGPWDLHNAYKMQLISKCCPPCKTPVAISCLGSHEVLNLPCYEAKATSCGRPCRRKLFCGNHTCSLECHDVSSARDLIMKSQECEDCNETCKKPRKPGCVHPCLRPCHPGECTPCKQHIKTKCHCEINSLYIPCSKWIEADDDEKKKLVSCSNRCPKTMTCGHRCYFSCHNGPCGVSKNCKKKVIIRCLCKRKKKEVYCYTQDKDLLLCDDDCLNIIESLKIQEYEERKKLEDQLKEKEEEELRDFLKKSEGKKKRKKKYVEKQESNNKYKTSFFIISAIIVCVLGLIICFLSQFINEK